jgi:two-component system, chemotaxis family, sensor kinase Cph1
VPLRILVVDDHEVVRHAVISLLAKRKDWQICGEAPDGLEALSRARELQPDLILMDVSMPRMDGLQATQAIRRVLPETKIILVSQNDPSLVRRQAVQAGADDYVAKDRVARELIPAIEKQFGGPAANAAPAAANDSNAKSSFSGGALSATLGASDPSGDEKLARMLRESIERNERQRRLYQTILSNTPDLIYVFDLKHRFTYANEALLTMWGKTWEEAIGKNCLELGYPEWHAKMHDEDIERVIATKKAVRGEVPFSGTSGRRVYDYIFAPVMGPSGEVEAIAGTTRDVTDRTNLGDALRQSEERFRALVNATSYVVYRLTPDFLNIRQIDGKGFTLDNAVSTAEWLRSYIHPDDRDTVQRRIDEALQAKSIFESEHREQPADGAQRWTYSRAVPLLDEKGDVVEWFGAASDVSDRKEAEEKYRKLAETLDAEVRARTRELEERNAEVLRQSEQVRELSWRLLRTQDEERRHIARELHDSAGQTLTVLGMNLAMLVEKAGRDSPELVNDAEKIQDTVQGLHRDIRTASYLLHPPMLDESGLSPALSWYVQGLVERSALQIELDISKEFGRLPRDMELVVFRLVQECLTNIHRHSGSKTASIRIARSRCDVTVEVHDQGQGMAPARFAEIQSGGAGVGIRGMRERLRQFSGEMKIDSDAQGTRVFVKIPLPAGGVKN